MKNSEENELKKRLSTFLRMTESNHGGESDEAVRQFFKLLRKHGLLRDLAEHPEWLWGNTDEGKLREAMEANRALAFQNEAVIRENTRLRQEVAASRKGELGGVGHRSMERMRESEKLQKYFGSKARKKHE